MSQVDKIFMRATASMIEKVLEQRGNRYGNFEDHARITQQLKQTMHNTPGWKRLSCDKKQSLEVIADKIGRILNGDPEYFDSWHDIEGYARLVSNTLKRELS